MYSFTEIFAKLFLIDFFFFLQKSIFTEYFFIEKICQTLDWAMVCILPIIKVSEKVHSFIYSLKLNLKF